MQPQASVELFLGRIGAELITVEEVYELLVMDGNYPYHKLKINNKVADGSQISPEAKQEITRSLLSEDFKIKALAEHALFKQLSGNPLSINLIASCRSNPSTPGISLKAIFEMVLANKG